MTIRFTKPRHADRPPTFTCIRANGTSTGMASTSFFVRHDLTHYVVETLLGTKQAFYGLLESGWTLDSFGERAPNSPKTRPLPEDAMLVERLVGVFDFESACPEPLRNDEVLDLIREACVAAGLSPHELPSDFVTQVRTQRAELIARWHLLGPGESLELVFG